MMMMDHEISSKARLFADTQWLSWEMVLSSCKQDPEEGESQNFGPNLKIFNWYKIIPLPPQRKRRMTMLLMMFLTHWLWQVGKCQQCWVEPGRATVQMCFSTTGACTQITSTNSCWLFKSSDCLVLYCCWIGRFNTETACGHHQETLSKKHPCLFWTTHSC